MSQYNYKLTYVAIIICVIIIIYPKTGVCSIQQPSLTVDSNPLKRVQSYKYLGVLITADLIWFVHLQVISTKAKKLLGMFYRRFYSSTSTCTTMLKLYKSFI